MASDGDLDFWCPKRMERSGKVNLSQNMGRLGRCLTIESVISILRFKVCPRRETALGNLLIESIYLKF